jgi:hypothetical protein
MARQSASSDSGVFGGKNSKETENGCDNGTWENEKARGDEAHRADWNGALAGCFTWPQFACKSPRLQLYSSVYPDERMVSRRRLGRGEGAGVGYAARGPGNQTREGEAK